MPFRTRMQRFALVLALAATPALAVSNDWPSFRGPADNGAVAAAGIFEGEVTGLAIDWRIPLGNGYSGIAVRDGRVFTQAAVGDDDVLVALDVDRGAELWRYRLGPRTEGHDGSEDGPSTTPAVDAERVYAATPLARVFAVDVESGEEAWSHDLVAELGVEVPLYEYAASPLLFGELVVFTTPGSAEGTLVAFDRVTGERRWTAAPGDVEYQSPIAAEIGGASRILLWQNERLVAVDGDGSVLWSAEAPGNSDTAPLPAGDDRLLLYGGRSSRMVRVTGNASGTEVETLWETNAFKGGNFSLPVIHDGHVYGYDRAFLSCVDAETGERLWKSRPPGGSGLILVEDRLVVYGSDGDVVLVAASPEGYAEETRIHATDRESLTWPAFAAGRIFVRDADHLAAVAVTDRPTPPTDITELPPALVPGSDFTAFVEQLRAADQRTAWLDHFFSTRDRFPLVEATDDGTLVHFVYRGTAEDVSVIPFHDRENELPLERVDGTGFFYRTMAFDPLLPFEYAFRLDLERVEPDPLNRYWVAGRTSRVLPPDHRDPEYLAPFTGAGGGTTETLELVSEHTGDTREVSLYLPSGTPSHLVVLLDASRLRTDGLLPNSLDHESGDTIAPTAVAFLPPAARSSFLENDGRRTPLLARLVVEELLPALRERFPALAEIPAERTMVMGADSASMAALYTAAEHPEAFGKALLLEFGGSFGLEAELAELQSSPAPTGAPEIVTFWNRNGTVMRNRDYRSAEYAAELAERLPEHGWDVTARVFEDSYGTASFRTMAVEILRAATND